MTGHVTNTTPASSSMAKPASISEMEEPAKGNSATIESDTQHNMTSSNGSTGKTAGSYMKLMAEDIKDESESDSRDMVLAAEIIEGSRNQPVLHEISGAEDIQQSPTKTMPDAVDMQESPTKRKRGRPRKSEVLPIKIKEDLTPRRSPRRAVQERRQELLRLEEERRVEEEQRLKEEQRVESKSSRGPRKNTRKSPSLESDESLSDDSYEEFESDEEPPSERPPKKTRSPSKRKPLASSSPGIERRTKKGRPSKQENVTKKVFSIFHMDDLEMNSEQAQSPPTKGPTDTADPTNGKSSKISLNFDNKGQSRFSSIPVISGLRKPSDREEPRNSTIVTKFIPMPVPAVDADGNISDPEFLNKHLSNVAIHLDQNARLIDERAFFLEGSEGYFEQHSLRFRPSSSSLAANAPQIDYEEFIPFIKLNELVYKREKDALQKLHQELYHQWCFELSQGYSLNFFGIGSKVNFIMEFVETYFMNWYMETIQDEDSPPSVMVINGYNPATKLKTIIHDIVSLLVTPEEKKQQNLRMPKHVSEALPFLMSYLKRDTRRSSYNGIVKATLVLVIHNIDGDAFRDTRSQNYLSQLASLPNVWLIVSTDNINLSLLWDLYRFKNFNFLWHDITTYNLYSVEMSFRDVLSMGKSKKFVGSKGAEYVLTSLTPNARSLYQILLQMQVEKLKEASVSQAGRTGLRGSTSSGLELRVLYETCVDKFVASNEINFKTMLGEFVEHKMCVLSKNPRGAELVYVPFTFDEMEKLLETKF